MCDLEGVFICLGTWRGHEPSRARTRRRSLPWNVGEGTSPYVPEMPRRKVCAGAVIAALKAVTVA